MIRVALPGAQVVFTAREHGDVREAAGLTALEAMAGRLLARGLQVHGPVVRRVLEAGADPIEADGQATARDDVAVMVQVADCLPVAIAGEGAVAMLHAGWRGLAAGVLEEGVLALRELGAQEPLAAVIGPGARGCCYEVGDEVREAFGATTRTVDLPTVAARQLAALGVERIDDVCCCSICDERYFSFRREGEAAGRQAGIAWRT
ncbi:MAG: purine-nucleoside/S-methyl-5-thioadenosine phosphorylase / adenosine deaminase [Solirubrobacteraceae bacterium]|nr:purine-nucleoside/S-methyl-5-thioadenosine phosphorylase / adenosine deaminase [Solirubrobacteraceae bacterium]